MSASRYVERPSDRRMTRSLSSPNSVDMNQNAPSALRTWPRSFKSFSASTIRLSPEACSRCREDSRNHTSNLTPNRRSDLREASTMEPMPRAIAPRVPIFLLLLVCTAYNLPFIVGHPTCYTAEP